MFIDYAKIYITSGAGGNGCISFRREKYVPKGGAINPLIVNFVQKPLIIP